MCLFLINSLSWAGPDALSPLGGNPDTYAELKQEMQRRYDLHNDVSVDPFIKSHLDSIYSLTGRIDPIHDFAAERIAIRKTLEDALTNSGAEDLLYKLENEIKVFNKATGKIERGVQIQLLVLKNDEKFPAFEGEEVRGHASNKYLTIFVKEYELSDTSSIAAKIFHEIRARSHKPDQELEKFEKISRKIDLEVKQNRQILDPALKKEFARLEFPANLDIMHRDYAMAETPLESSIPLMSGQKAIADNIILPLTPEYIRSLSPEVIINNESATRQLKQELRDAISLYPDFNSNFDKGTSDNESITFKRGRLRVTFFKDTQAGSSEYIFSISNDKAVIGHGMARYEPEEQKVLLRYSIHGGYDIPEKYNFRRYGYGTEALPIIMSACAGGHLFEGAEIRKLARYSAVADSLLPGEIEKLNSLFRKAGFDKNYEFDMSGGRISQRPSLAEAISLIRRFKEQNPQGTANAAYVTALKAEASALYNRYRLYDLPLRDRVRFCVEVFDHTSFPQVNVAVLSIYDTVILSQSQYGHTLDGTFNLMSPPMYNVLANMLSIFERTRSLDDNSNIRFAVDMILFDFLKPGEKRVIELLWLTGEIEKELKKPGSGELPVIAAMQDLHGGAARALALTGFVLGLPADCYKRLRTLSDLQSALAEAHISVDDQDIRFIGLNDKYDRGEDPEGAFELVRWLRDTGKAKPFVGNHDFWRALSVLGVHLIPGVSMERAHGVGYWSREAMEHAGWGTIELDQINERRFNAEIARVNIGLKQYRLPLLDPIDLRKFRGDVNNEMKRLKAQNAEIRRENELHRGESGYQRKDEHKLPDIFTKSIDYLREQIFARNESIRAINTGHRLDIPCISFQEVNLDNYMDDPDVVARTLWELKNFRLFYIDIFGNIHMHSLIPLDFKNRKVMVNYKGLHGIPALEMMQGDIRNFFEGMTKIPNSQSFRLAMWGSLGEAFTEINRWYSDIDAHAKALSVKRFVENGGPAGFGNEFIGSAVTQFADRYATFLMIIGHNERRKFDEAGLLLPWISLSPETGSGLVNIDYEMSEGYSDRGAVMTLFKRDENGRITGMKKWGYPAADKTAGVKQADVVNIEDITMTDTEGLSERESAMLRELSDGEKFMRWYHLKALNEAMVLMGAVIEGAIKTGRFEKEKEYKKLQIRIGRKIARIKKYDDETKTQAVIEQEAEAKIIHDENIKHTPSIPQNTILYHVIPDSILLDEQQRQMVQLTGQYMKRKNYSERIVRLEVSNPANFIEELNKLIARERDNNKDYNVQFCIACPDAGSVGKVLELDPELRALAFEPSDKVIQVEGIMLALRALYSNDIENLKRAFNFLAGDQKHLSTAELSITDINEFVRRVTFILPSAKELGINEAGELNKLMRRYIESAA